MVEVLFYHLTSQPLERVLPLLVARTHERNQRALIRGGSEERLRVLDDALWTFDEESFIPHGLASEPRPEEQPVLLTLAHGDAAGTREGEGDAEGAMAGGSALSGAGSAPTLAGNINRADVLFLIDQAPLPAAWDFARVVVMFDDGDEEAKTFARGQWKTVKALGHAATYWQQDEGGRWVKKG